MRVSARTRVREQVFQKCAQDLVSALDLGCADWPLPQPIFFDLDFPPIEPISPSEVIEKGLAFFEIDKGMMDYHLNSIVDLIVPHTMNLSDDPFEIHEKWLARRTDDVSKRLLFRIATEWFAQAMDPQAPNTDRWWMCVALLNGLSDSSRGLPVHQGYHLIESIAIGARPGSWHTQPDVGPQHMDWNPHAVLPKNPGMNADSKGADVAKWYLDKLLASTSERKLLAIKWIQLLLEREELFVPLELGKYLKTCSNDPNEEVASSVVLCLAKALERDKEAGKEIVSILSKRDELLIRRGMADVLTRLFRRITWDAVPLLEKMLSDEDTTVLAAASATVGDLKFLDEERWADKLLELCSHDEPIVRRNIVSSLRDYITKYPEDDRNIIPRLFTDGDEVVMTRLKELLLRMDEVDCENLSSIISRISKFKDNVDFSPLWNPMEVRKPGRSVEWKNWLAGIAERPQNSIDTSQSHVSTMEEPDELPALDDALAHLDQELGFLD